MSDQTQEAILEALKDRPRTFDELVADTGQGGARLMGALRKLEQYRSVRFNRGRYELVRSERVGLEPVEKSAPAPLPAVTKATPAPARVEPIKAAPPVEIPKQPSRLDSIAAAAKSVPAIPTKVESVPVAAPAPATKVCRVCKDAKPMDAFHHAATHLGGDGRRRTCIACEDKEKSLFESTAQPGAAQPAQALPPGADTVITGNIVARLAVLPGRGYVASFDGVDVVLQQFLNGKAQTIRLTLGEIDRLIEFREGLTLKAQAS
jgi:hypothetical protein